MRLLFFLIMASPSARVNGAGVAVKRLKKPFNTLTFWRTLQTFCLCGFREMGGDKKSVVGDKKAVVWGQKIGSLGTKNR